MRSRSGTVSRTRARQLEIALDILTDGLVSPVAMADPVDGTGRLFVADQVGTVWSVSPSGELGDRPVLDLRRSITRLNPGYDERGLLGLAFHPGFRDNQRLFVYYTAPPRPGAPLGWDHTNRVVEYEMSRDEEVVDVDTERVILEVDHPYTNHNGGDITFGPDGYLYIPIGDGGNYADKGRGHNPVSGNAQDLSTFLGKILRVDIDSGEPYSIPTTNPFTRKGERREIYAYGLRNPWRISFDREGENELYAGDVGQYLWEEVDIIVPGGNYGWRVKEGHHCFNPDDPMRPKGACLNEGPWGESLIDPILEYPNSSGQDGIGTAVIGGYVYRGRKAEQLQGRYVFGDWSRDANRGDGLIFAGTKDEEGWRMEEVAVEGRKNGRLGEYLLSFGQDGNGELYVLTSERMGPTGTTGRIYQVV